LSGSEAHHLSEMPPQRRWFHSAQPILRASEKSEIRQRIRLLVNHSFSNHADYDSLL
jgi:hypothetical protein